MTRGLHTKIYHHKCMTKSVKFLNRVCHKNMATIRQEKNSYSNKKTTI